MKDPTLQDKVSILTRTFHNKKMVWMFLKKIYRCIKDNKVEIKTNTHFKNIIKNQPYLVDRNTFF